ncbi:hypothetical protein WSS_A25935 [Rhodococcus opacus M213]|uniref:General stress protein FMN-binding split barrel domain-containing protein n=1 Tax=Rhodococcus opacus M213 TaxID=1129896 RepID=K8XDT0_RHOOP|nr:pyridoxamine 5'-phosphate oxidase family protein [Rhodococcus opacus]EKT79728.1 hypothetical protein WSS_A25935 [Rhodococcus opacus M213]
MANANVHKLHTLLQSLDTVMLTTIDDRYRLVSRPMVLRVEQFDGSLMLFAPVMSRVISHIAARAAVNVSFSSTERSLSLTGTADFTTDRDRVEDLWHDGLTPWLPRGPHGAAAIEVTIDEARFWTVPGALDESRWEAS